MIIGGINVNKVKIYIPDFSYHKKVRNNNSSRGGVVKYKGCEITRNYFKDTSKKRFEPQGFKSRSQHQYEGSKNWDDDSVSIDMESYLSYSI